MGRLSVGFNVNAAFVFSLVYFVSFFVFVFVLFLSRSLSLARLYFFLFASLKPL